MSVRRAQQEISSTEFAEWMAFFRLEPFGRAAEDRPAARVAATLANIHRPRNSRPFKTEDFELNYDRELKPQTLDEQMRIARMLTRSHGGAVH